MRAIWVEVVGSVMELFYFRVQWNAIISSRATLREKRQACCQRANSKVLGPAVYKRYCRVQRNQEFVPVQLEGSHWPWSEIKAVSAVPYDKAVALAACRQPEGCRRIPFMRGKPVSAINTVRKSQTVSRWGPWKFRPSTAYGAFVQTRVPGQWVGKSCAVPGHHNSVGQMSPERIQLLLLLLLPCLLKELYWNETT